MAEEEISELAAAVSEVLEDVQTDVGVSVLHTGTLLQDPHVRAMFLDLATTLEQAIIAGVAADAMAGRDPIRASQANIIGALTSAVQVGFLAGRLFAKRGYEIEVTE